MANRVGHATANSRYENEIVEVLERTMPLTPGHNRNGSRGSNQGKLFDLLGGSHVQIYEGRNRRRGDRRSNPSADRQVGSNGLEQTRSNPGNPVQVRQSAVGSVAVPVRDDPLRQGEPNPRQPSQLESSGTIGIKFLPWCQRAVSRLRRFGMSGGTTAGSGAQQLDITRSGIGASDQVTNSLAGHGKGQEDKNRPAFGRHGTQ